MVCPECGGDATRVRDRYPSFLRKSKAFRWVVIGIMLSIYAGFIIYMSGWYTSSWTPPPARPNDAMQTKFASIETDTLTLDEFMRAIRDDDELLDRLREQFRDVLGRETSYGVPAEIGRVRLGVPSFSEWDARTRTYSILGPLIHIQEDTLLRDQRTREPMPVNPLALEQVQRRYWPAYDVQSDHAGGTKRRGFSFHYTRLFAIITFIAMASWIISLLPRVRNHKWRALVLSSAAMITVGALIAWLTPQQWSDINGVWIAPIESSPWIEQVDIEASISDRAQFRALLRSKTEGMATFLDRTNLKNQIQQGYTFGVAIGHEYRSLSPRSERPRVIGNTHAELAFREPLVRFKSIYAQMRVQYDQELTTAQRDLLRHNTFLENLNRYGSLRIERFSGNQMRQYTLDVTTLLITLSVPFWAWVMVDRLGFLRIWHLQRMRVRRGLCIYCGYEVSDEALAARREDRRVGT